MIYYCRRDNIITFAVEIKELRRYKETEVSITSIRYIQSQIIYRSTLLRITQAPGISTSRLHTMKGYLWCSDCEEGEPVNRPFETWPEKW
jgi:hypothetical protein